MKACLRLMRTFSGAGRSSSEYIHGIHSCTALIDSSSRTIFRAYVEAGASPARQMELVPLLSHLESAGLGIVKTDRSTLQRLCKTEYHQGIVLEVSEIEAPIVGSSEELLACMPHLSNAPQLLSRLSTDTPPVRGVPLVALLDGITDPHNVGAILRSAFLLGVDGILLTQRNCSPLNSTVSKTSAGALEYLAAGGRLAIAKSLSALLKDLRSPQKGLERRDNEGPHASSSRAASSSSQRMPWVLLAAGLPPSEASSSQRKSSSSSSSSSSGAMNAMKVASSNKSLVDEPSKLHERTKQHSSDAQVASIELDRIGELLTTASQAQGRGLGGILLVLGGEGEGVRDVISHECTSWVHIPHATSSLSPASTMGHAKEVNGRAVNSVDSLNVSVAAGILFREIDRALRRI